jgi:hypothetical protein
MTFMKKILLIIGVFALFLSAGCVAPNDNDSNPIPTPGNPNSSSPSGWWAYAPVQASTNPWQTLNLPFHAEKGEMQQVQEWLSSLSIDTTPFGFIPHDERVCEALNCPRGDYLIVHAPHATAERTLIQNGFFPYGEEGVLVQASGTTPGTYLFTLINATNDWVYYGGCNDFTLEKITDSATIPIIPRVCVWEGLPSPLNPRSTQTFEWEAVEDGQYRVVIGYGTECDSTKPLSQNTCGKTSVIYSLPFLVKGVSKVEFVKMRYEIKQCNTNPWQNPDNQSPNQETDQLLFSEWLGENGIMPTLIQYLPIPADFTAYAACSSPQGDHYELVIPLNQRVQAEALGFVYGGLYAPALSTPPYAEAQWFVFTPYQCYANKWNTQKLPVHSVETDLQLMKEWLEENGVGVDYLTFIRGVSLSQECTKLSTDKYGVGALSDESAQLLPTLGFVPAGKTQVELFTGTTDVKPLTLLYKSKFCTQPPWGGVEFKSGNEAETSEAVAQWLANQGMELLGGKPTIHQIAPSFSGSCDTDSGIAVKVTVPSWSKTHLTAEGFQEPSYSFEQQQTQVYPPLDMPPLMDKVGVWVSKSMNTPEGGTYTITILNTWDAPIYFGGCNEFTLEKINLNSTTTSIIPKTCGWEGLPSPLNAGATTPFEWNAPENGQYHVVFWYGMGCDSTKPLSQNTCERVDTVYSLPFTVNT